MNELLHDVLTDMDYKKLSTFNLLLSKSSSDKFEHHVLKLLHDIFGFDHTFFLTYSDEGYVNTVVKNNINKRMDDYMNYYKKKEVISEYLYEHRYEVDSQQVIVLNDILERNCNNHTEHFDDLLNNTFFYDMYLLINKNGDGIRILREQDKGAFTQNEKEIGNYLCNILASQYKIIQENRNLNDEMELMNKNMENMNFGFIMLSREFELVSSNKLALCYSSDITGSYDINDVISHFKAMIHKEFSDTLQDSYNHSFHKSINSFIIEIISTTVINKDNKIDHYYMVYIYNKIWFNRIFNKINYTKEKYNLTNREKEIVSLVSKGLSNKEIAESLFISIYTVKEHMKNISKKMNVNSRTGIISKLAI